MGRLITRTLKPNKPPTGGFFVMEVSITLPTELKDIKIWQIHEYEKLNKDREDVEVLINMVSIFCELPTSDTRQMPYKTLIYCANKITEALGQEPKLVHTFTLGGVEYGFVPNLDDVSVGEFVDIENYEKDRSDLWKLLSVLYRPIVYKSEDKYRIADYQGNLVSEFRNLNAEIGYGALLFFCSIGNDLLDYTLKSLLPKKVVQSATLNKLEYPESGDGLLSFTHLLKEMYLELSQLQGKNFILHYNGLPTKWISQKWKRKSPIE